MNPTIPSQNTRVQTLVDGGYLTWVHGAIGYKSWQTVRGNYTRRAGVLICLDSPESARKLFYPEYKSHRKEKRNKRPEIHERVKEFQKYIREDPTLRTLEIIGLEADDLVAILQSRYHLPVIGADKDLMQLSNIQLSKIDGTQVQVETFAKRQPKKIRDHIQKPGDILLTLCLMGDDSDDIPRLIPPRNLELFNSIMSYENPWYVAHDLFKEELIRNLMLSVLPSPWCFDPQPEPMEILWSVAAGTWPRSQFLRYDLATILQDLESQNVLGY